MHISVTEFKRRCVEIVRRVEDSGEAVYITRRGKIVAQLEPSSQSTHAADKPWERLRALGGKLAAQLGESAGQVVLRRAGRYTSEDLHRTLFPKRPPKTRTIEEMKAGIERHAKTRRARSRYTR